MVSIPCVYCDDYFEPLDTDDFYWRSHKICRANYFTINSNLPSFLSEKLLDDDNKLLSEIANYSEIKFDSWVFNIIDFSPIGRSISKQHNMYIPKNIHQNFYKLIKFYLSIDEPSSKFFIEKIYANGDIYDKIEILLDQRKILQKNSRPIQLVKTILIRCQLCNIVFDCTIPEDFQFESHKECRVKHIYSNTKFDLFLDTMDLEENDKKIILNLHSFFHEKGISNFYNFIEDRFIFKLPYESYFKGNDVVRFKNHFFMEIHIGQNISDFLSKLRITKIICFDDQIINTVQYYFENIGNITIHFPLEKYVNKETFSNDYYDYNFCQFCHKIFKVTPEVNFLLSHQTCREKITKINEHFESFLGSKIVEEDKKVLLALNKDEFFKFNPLPPFHSWINTNNKVSMLFKEIVPSEEDFRSPQIEVLLQPINLELFKIKSIVTDFKSVKQFLFNLNRTDIPVTVK